MSSEHTVTVDPLLCDAQVNCVVSTHAWTLALDQRRLPSRWRLHCLFRDPHVDAGTRFALCCFSRCLGHGSLIFRDFTC